MRPRLHTKTEILRITLLALSLNVAALVLFAQETSPQPPPVDTFSGNPRVVILSDIGTEPDDQMSFVRLLLYSNQLDLEAMIASTSTWQRAATHPETMRALIDAYGQVRGNLLLHAKGWPKAEDLNDRVFARMRVLSGFAFGAARIHWRKR